jgi:hypothetical protein
MWKNPLQLICAVLLVFTELLLFLYGVTRSEKKTEKPIKPRKPKKITEKTEQKKPIKPIKILKNRLVRFGFISKKPKKPNRFSLKKNTIKALFLSHSRLYKN